MRRRRRCARPRLDEWAAFDRPLPDHRAGARDDRRRLAADSRGEDRAGSRRLRDLAGRSRSRPRPARQPLGSAACRAQGGAGEDRHRRGRQDSLRSRRRGPGDDRHLRVRARPVPPAVGQDDAERTSGSPTHGDVASARSRRRDLRVQLPRRRVLVEHRPRARRRRRRGVEALGERRARRPRRAVAAGPGRRRGGGTGGSRARPRRRSRHRRRHGPRRPGGAGLGDGIGAHGP